MEGIHFDNIIFEFPATINKKRNKKKMYDVTEVTSIIEGVSEIEVTFTEDMLGNTCVFSLQGMRAFFNMVEELDNPGIFTCAGYSFVIGRNDDGTRLVDSLAHMQTFY